MAKSIVLRGDALRIAKLLDAERIRVNEAITRERNMAQLRVNALMQGWVAFSQPLFQQIAQILGTDLDRTNIDDKHFRDTGLMFAVVMDLPREAEPEEPVDGEEQTEAPAAPTVN